MRRAKQFLRYFRVCNLNRYPDSVIEGNCDRGVRHVPGRAPRLCSDAPTPNLTNASLGCSVQQECTGFQQKRGLAGAVSLDRRSTGPAASGREVAGTPLSSTAGSNWPVVGVAGESTAHILQP